MKNERNTENIVRKLFKQNNFNSKAKVEEQKSTNGRVANLLKKASKNGTGKGGYPEFIVTTSLNSEFICIVECKADIKEHESPERDNPIKYAVDGVLTYASYLSKEFNVIAIAVSGEKEGNMKISNFFWKKNGTEAKELGTKEILPFEDYIHIVENDEEVIAEKISDLISFSKELHNYMRDYAKLSETEKPLLVSGILIALYDKVFASSYKLESSALNLSMSVVSTIRKVLTASKIPYTKLTNMMQPYSFISVHEVLTEGDVLKELIIKIDKEVLPFITKYHNVDIVGQFYGEFLRYTGGDKKGLGIVLTPKHITELFTKIANLTTDSVVLDTCTGTGGFLISAMQDMVKKANGDSNKIKNILSNNLIGVEQQPNMYAMAASNMILRGDGKANLFLGSCFNLTNQIKNKKPTVGLINPPYSQKGEGLSELDFIYHLLTCLEKNGIAVSIVPMSCVISDSPIKEKIMKEHTLEAVMSMPDELFSPVGTVTCIMVLRAHVPHLPNYESWFGYWKEDGFEKNKSNGRVDIKGKWKEIEQEWLDNYINRREIPGKCIKKCVTFKDEWCAEAYLETDFSTLSVLDFEEQIRKFAAFQISRGVDL